MDVVPPQMDALCDAPIHKRNALLLKIAVATGIIACLMGAYYVYAHAPFTAGLRALVATAFLPQELKSAVLIDTEKGTTNLHTVSGLTFKNEAVTGTIISIENRAPNSARIVLDAKGKYSLTVNGKEVYATSSPMAGVSVSPDGTKVAFGLGRTPLLPLEQPQLIPSSSFDSRNWSVVVLTLATGAKEPIGTGSAPLFMDAAHVARFAPGAIVITDLQAQKETFALPGVFNRAPVTVLQSPDRTLIAWKDTFAKTITVYKITATKAETDVTVPYTGGGLLTLGNDAFYTTRPASYGTGVWSETLLDKKAKNIGSVFSLFHISRIVMGSI